MNNDITVKVRGHIWRWDERHHMWSNETLNNLWLVSPRSIEGQEVVKAWRMKCHEEAMKRLEEAS